MHNDFIAFKENVYKELNKKDLKLLSTKFELINVKQ